MAKKPQEPKVELEREYIIPLRKQWLKVPEYKRANKAVKAIKQFLVKHMKVYDRDLRKIKINILLNNEVRFRGMRKPPARIKVRAKKYDDGKVKVELVDIPPIIKFKLDREKRKEEAVDKKKTEEAKRIEAARKAAEEAGKKEKEEEKKEGVEAEKEEEKKEKKESTIEAGLKAAKQTAKQAKHISTGKKQPKIQRKALAK